MQQADLYTDQENQVRILWRLGERCKEIEPDNDCFEQCLIGEWDKPRPQYGIPVGTDCQEYDDKVVSGCRKQCDIKEKRWWQ